MRRLLALAVAALLAIAPANAQLLTLGAGKGGPSTGGGGPVMMVTPIMTPGISSTISPSNSATNYMGLIGNGSANAYSTTIANRQVPIGLAGTIDNLKVNFQTTIASGSGATGDCAAAPASGNPCYSVSLNVNGTSQTLKCQVFNGQQDCSDAAANGHGKAISPADIVVWQITPTGTPTAQTNAIQISATFTSTTGQESPLFGGLIFSNMSTTVAGYFAVGVSFSSPTEVNASSYIPGAGTIDTLYVQQNGVSGTSASYRYTLYLNGSATGLVCTVGAAVLTCNTTPGSNPVAVVPTDMVSLQSCPSNGTGTNPTVTCQAGSAPTARQATFSVRWVPTTSNQALLMQVVNTVPATNSTRYIAVEGAAGVSDATEVNEYAIAPVLASNMTMGNLYVAQGAAPGGVTTRLVTLRAGAIGGSQSNQTPSCNMTSAITTCNDTTHTYQPTTATLLNFSTVPTGTNAALVYYKISMTVTVP